MKTSEKLIRGIINKLVKTSIGTGGGYIEFIGGVLIQWGTVSFAASSGTCSTGISFPKKFKDTNIAIAVCGGRNIITGVLSECNNAGNPARTAEGTTLTWFKTGSPYSGVAYWIAIGGGTA